MRIFKTKTLAKFTKQNGINDASLVEAIDRAVRGLVDADLGGQLIKQRVARPGQGKRSGFRMIIGTAPTEPYFCSVLPKTNEKISMMISSKPCAKSLRPGLLLTM